MSWQIAIGTDDVYKTAEAIKLSGGKITREPGPLPGINTKITACVDPDGWKSVWLLKSLCFCVLCLRIFTFHKKLHEHIALLICLHHIRVLEGKSDVEAGVCFFYLNLNIT